MRDERSLNKVFFPPEKEMKESLFSNLRKTSIPFKFMKKSNGTLEVIIGKAKDYT